MGKSPIGKILGERRIALGLAVRDVSEKSGIEKNKIIRIEHGVPAYPSEDVLIAIGAALGILEDEVLHLAGYDDGIPLMYKTFPHLMPDKDEAGSRIIDGIMHPEDRKYFKDSDFNDLADHLEKFFKYAEKKRGSKKLNL